MTTRERKEQNCNNWLPYDMVQESLLKDPKGVITCLYIHSKHSQLITETLLQGFYNGHNKNSGMFTHDLKIWPWSCAFILKGSRIDLPNICLFGILFILSQFICKAQRLRKNFGSYP